MDICMAVFNHLTEDFAITEMVGDRIYPIIMPQNSVMPAIVYSPTLGKYDTALQHDTGYTRQTIQLNCHDKTFKGARRLSRLVKSSLQDYKGLMSGLDVQAVFIKSDFMGNGNTSEKYSTEEYMAVIEVEFHFNEK